jgi:hypothetical protein
VNNLRSKMMHQVQLYKQLVGKAGAAGVAQKQVGSGCHMFLVFQQKEGRLA